MGRCHYWEFLWNFPLGASGYVEICGWGRGVRFSISSFLFWYGYLWIKAQERCLFLNLHNFGEWSDFLDTFI